MENLNNVADTLAVDILTSVVSEDHREGLRIESDRDGLLEGGSVLQFDQCYTGMQVCRKLRVKNTTVHAMDISLGSDRPGEVWAVAAFVRTVSLALVGGGVRIRERDTAKRPSDPAGPARYDQWKLSRG